MAAARRPTGRTPPTPSGSDEELRAKYTELSRTYSALVQRLERRRRREISVYKLGWWGLKASDVGMALVQDGRVSMTNERWNELTNPVSPAWEQLGPAGVLRRRYGSLHELALGEAALLAPRPDAERARRFHQKGGEQTIEVGVKRMAVPGNLVAVQVHDVTAQALGEQELALMREALFQKEHLRVVGELAAAVAHDLGNSLRSLSARLTALAQGLPGAVAAPLLESVEAAVKSVRQLHELARSGRLEPGPMRLRGIIEHAVDVLRMQAQPGATKIDVRLRVADVPPVFGTVAELSHLFVSLLLNACDAMPQGGRVEVRARRRGDRVVVTVADTGTGIAPQHLPQLFQPFFTTKGPAGTGLGLWLAASAMRRLGASISARNRKPRGAEFRLELRVAGIRALSGRGGSRPLAESSRRSRAGARRA